MREWRHISVLCAKNEDLSVYIAYTQGMSVVIPVRVPRSLAQRINELIGAGLYSNRSGLIREALRRFLISESSPTQRVRAGRAVATLASTIIAWSEKNVTDVILFGSTARGEAAAESDIDLLVLIEGAEPWIVRQHLYDLIYPIIPALEVDISLIAIKRDLFTRMMEKGDPFALSVIREGKQLQGSLLHEYNKGPPGKGFSGKANMKTPSQGPTTRCTTRPKPPYQP